MNNTIDSGYCRLCAKLKPHKTMVNLQNDEETCQQVIKKLFRFNIMMDFQDNVLPKTVCLACVKCLEQSFSFVIAVEQAQAFLSDFILVHVTPTESDSYEVNMLYEPPDDDIITVIVVKDEKSRESMEIKDDDTNLSEKCDSEVMSDVCNDDCVTNESISSTHVDDIYFGNTEELETVNINGVKHSIDIVENTVANDECGTPKWGLSPEIVSDLHQVEDNRKSVEVVSEKVHNNHSEPLQNTVCCKENINKQINSNSSPMNMVKNALKAKLEQRKNKPLTTTLSSEKNIKKSQRYSYQPVPKYVNTDVKQIKQTWQDYEWKCSYCGTIFPNIEELQNHSKQYHKACNLYQCTDCSTRRSKLNLFMHHVITHRNYLAQSCYRCFEIFPSRDRATTHKRKFHDYFYFFCPGCNTPFDTNKQLQAHMDKYYNKITTIIPSHLTCGICNKKSEDVKEFKRHSQTHKSVKDWFCEICGKRYTTKGNLKEHLECAHGSLEKSFRCDICDASFFSKKRLHDHIITIHIRNKQFICDYCGKSYHTRTQIIVHIKSHRNSRDYACTVCNKKFKYRCVLKQHMLQHTGEKPLSCHICSRDFADRSNRYKHIRRKHGIEMAKKKSLTGKKQTEPNSPGASP